MPNGKYHLDPFTLVLMFILVLILGLVLFGYLYGGAG